MAARRGLAERSKSMAVLLADTVGSMLHDPALQEEALCSLEKHTVPIDKGVGLAAAQAVAELMATAIPRVTFDRAGLLLGRLTTEAYAHYGHIGAAEMLGRLMGGGHGAPLLGSTENVVARAIRPHAEPKLTKADARSYACACAWGPGACTVGFSADAEAAMGLTAGQFFALWYGTDPVYSWRKNDDVPNQMLKLLLELLREGGAEGDSALPDELVAGALWGVLSCVGGGHFSVARYQSLCRSTSLFPPPVCHAQRERGVL